MITLIVLLWLWLQMRYKDGAAPEQHGDSCLRAWRLLVWPEGLENTGIMVLSLFPKATYVCAKTRHLPVFSCLISRFFCPKCFC